MVAPYDLFAAYLYVPAAIVAKPFEEVQRLSSEGNRDQFRVAPPAGIADRAEG